MELTEPIELVNKQLIEHYGVDTITGKPIWRVVWSNDQRELRKVSQTDEGIHLLWPEVRECKKYPWIKDRFILERLELVPLPNLEELPTQHQSYETKWTFEDALENPVPPKFYACKMIIDVFHAALGKNPFPKYAQSTEDALKEQDDELRKVTETLYGNETTITDALALKSGVGYTGPSKMESK